MATSVFPIFLYEILLPKLLEVLELTQQTLGISNPQSRQKLLQATINFKNAMAQARDFANNLPGGELLIEEQDDVIRMLETLKELKKAQLSAFVERKVASTACAHNLKLEIDSVASTPFQSDG